MSIADMVHLRASSPDLSSWVAEIDRALTAGSAVAVRSLCARLAASLRVQRITRDGRPYLERYTVADFGKGRERIHLHRFVAGDGTEWLHCHPWARARSVILAGGYIEHRHGSSPRVLGAGDLNCIAASDYHRVELRETDCWTLFNTGAPSPTPSWYFWSPSTGVRVHHLDANR